MQGFRYVSSSQSFNPSAAVNADRDTITIDNHGFQTGDLLVYRTDPTKTVPENIYTFSSASPNTPTLLGTITCQMPRSTGWRLDSSIRYEGRCQYHSPLRSIFSSLRRGGHRSDLQLQWNPSVWRILTLGGWNSNHGHPGSHQFYQCGHGTKRRRTTLVGCNRQCAHQRGSAASGAPNAIEFVKQLRGKANKKQNDNASDQESGIPLEFAGTFGINILHHTVEATVGSTAVSPVTSRHYCSV